MDSGGQPLLASTNSYPSFLIDNFDARQGDVDPDPLLVLSLRPASCCHSLGRLRESGTLMLKYPRILLMARTLEDELLCFQLGCHRGKEGAFLIKSNGPSRRYTLFLQGLEM